jgi:RecA-family ATPase
MTNFIFSLGKNTFDNCPTQFEVQSFDEFASVVESNKSPRKGLIYICSGLAQGVHYEKPTEFLGAEHWRLKNYALPRKYLAFDFDGFESPAIFEQVCTHLKQYNCLIYTTASHTEEAPRARALIELNRPVNYLEGEALGIAAQRDIESAIGIGLIEFDKSVYRATQPIYTPVLTSTIFRHKGSALNVDMMINKYPICNGLDATTKSLIIHTSFEMPKGDILEGSRNDIMLSYVGQLRSKGIAEHEIQVLAQAINEARFSPPFDEDEGIDICSRYSKQAQSSTTWSLPNIELTNQPLELQGGYLFISTTPPPKRDYVFSNQVTGGTLCTIGGSGGVSKTMLTLQMAVAAAIGQDMAGIQIAEGSSLLFLGEEDDAERDRRIGAICAHTGADHKLVSTRIKCFGAAGMDIRLTQKIESNPQPTGLAEKIIELANQHAEISMVPVRMIVIDHARLVLGGDPNDAQDVTQLTRVLTHIAHETKAAVFLLAHSPKSVMGKQGDEINASDIAGSSAFVDNSRAAFMMWSMRDKEAKEHHVSDSERSNYLRIENVKANYARTGGGHWLKRTYLPDWDVAVLEEARIYSSTFFQSKSSTDLQSRILEQLRKKPGGVTERKLRDIAGKDGVLKASEAKVRTEVEKMLDEGLITSRAPTPDERKQYRLQGQVREILVASAG